MMRNSVIKFLDDRFGDFELIPHEKVEKTFYLAKGDSFYGVINKKKMIFHINRDLRRMVNKMFDLDNSESDYFVKKWVEQKFGIKDCEISQIYRSEL